MPILLGHILKEVGISPGEKGRGVQLDRREVENISDNMTSGQRTEAPRQGFVHRAPSESESAVCPDSALAAQRVSSRRAR